jgi:hypothetical protein
MNRKFLIIFNGILLGLSNNLLQAEENFSLQGFLNNLNTLAYMEKNGMQDLRLFNAQKRTKQAFNNFNLNEADEFHAISYPENKGIKFNRSLTTLTQTNHRWLNFPYPFYATTYPINNALQQVIKTCGVTKQEQLTRFGINRPATNLATIVYIFTFKYNEQCVDSIFDTYNKEVTCGASSSNCFFDEF